MEVDPSGRTIARKQFVVGAARPRVWDLLAAVTYQQLPLEQVDITSLDSFRAVLRLKIGFIPFSFCVEGKLVDTSRPDSYGCVILVKRAPVCLGVKVMMILSVLDENRTEIFCAAIAEGKRTLMGMVLRRMQRNFAEKVFDSIGGRLQRLCPHEA